MTRNDKLTPKMIEALRAAATGRNAPNMHGTYKALAKRGLVTYEWGRAEGCWPITEAGKAACADTPPPLYVHKRSECNAALEDAKRTLLEAGLSPSRWNFAGMDCGHAEHVEDLDPPTAPFNPVQWP